MFSLVIITYKFQRSSRVCELDKSGEPPEIMDILVASHDSVFEIVQHHRHPAQLIWPQMVTSYSLCVMFWQWNWSKIPPTLFRNYDEEWNERLWWRITRICSELINQCSHSRPGDIICGQEIEGEHTSIGCQGVSCLLLNVPSQTWYWKMENGWRDTWVESR